MEEDLKRKKARMDRWIRRRSMMHQAKRKMLLPFIKLRKPREIVWERTYGGMFPACPRCGELVYYKDMCVFCGQRFTKNDKTVGGVMDAGEC